MISVSMGNGKHLVVALKFATSFIRRGLCCDQYKIIQVYPSTLVAAGTGNNLSPILGKCVYLSFNLQSLNPRFYFGTMSDFDTTKMSNDRNPTLIQLDTPEFHRMFSKGLVILQRLFAENDYDLRLCGGAVRDLLLGNTPKDLDFATIATPQQMISMFKKEDIRLINEGGWSHGTVTCRLEEENFEITTLRIDRVTDGRHAVVEFTTDWKVDASRRDLTINSMFLTLDGKIIDFFNGVDDLKNRRIRFVGEAVTRIQEDYLRILRFFRFYGRIADHETQLDDDTLKVISENVSGLNRVAGERIQTELKLIFYGNHVVRIVRMMHRCGLFSAIGLPDDADLDEFETIYNNSRHLSPHYMTYVSALLPTSHHLNVYHQRVKFSNLELNIARYIIQNRSQLFTGDKLEYYVDLVVECYKRDKTTVNSFKEFLKYKGDTVALNYFNNFKIPHFPVKGNILKERTGLKGKNVGTALEILFKRWKNSRYTLTCDELLENIHPDTDWDQV